MLNKDFFDGVERIEIKQGKRGSRGEKKLTIDAGKSKLFIPKVITSELKWRDKERVDLFRVGKTFFLKPQKVGLMTVNTLSGGAMMIYSKNLCLELMSRTKSCREYDAWVEEAEGVTLLLFRPKEGEE